MINLKFWLALFLCFNIAFLAAQEKDSNRMRMPSEINKRPVIKTNRRSNANACKAISEAKIASNDSSRMMMELTAKYLENLRTIDSLKAKIKTLKSKAKKQKKKTSIN